MGGLRWWGGGVNAGGMFGGGGSVGVDGQGGEWLGGEIVWGGGY